MNKNEQQYQIRTRERADTADADRWLASQGLSAGSFAGTPTRLLQAQRQAHVLLSQHKELLTQEQRATLEGYQKKMADRKARTRIKPKLVNEVLNIGSKINRQVFKLYKQTLRATEQGTTPGI